MALKQELCGICGADTYQEHAVWLLRDSKHIQLAVAAGFDFGGRLPPWIWLRIFEHHKGHSVTSCHGALLHSPDVQQAFGRAD